MILLDTSTLLFWTLDRTKLSVAAEAAIGGADRILLLSLSFWEIGVKTQKGKLTLPGPLPEFVSRIKRVDRVEIVAMDENIWVETATLNWAHRDPADRALVATATLLECPMVTSDLAIREYFTQAIW
ncbi:MAG: type II toxin-antitoxin system VapC family toxin [Caldilineaceae bacterium]